jgi:aspartate 1-decarboxylase
LFAALFAFSFISPTFISAQETSSTKVVRGTIKDASNGSVLPGATVRLKSNSRVVTVSDVNGAFSLTVPDNNSVLIISYTGYQEQQVSASSGLSVDVALQPAASELNQVVVVGYGTQTKKTSPFCENIKE